MKKKRFLTAFSDVIGQNASYWGFYFDKNIQILGRAWPKIVGPSIMNHAWPYRIYNDKLIVNVDHPVWHQELRMLSYTLLTRIREILPSTPIRHIELKLGKLPKDNCISKESIALQKKSLSPRDEALISHSTQSIGDENIREYAIRAMTSALSHSSTKN